MDFDLPALEPGLVDEIVTVDDETSFDWARRLARQEGILAGGSSGTAVAAAAGVARTLEPGANVVALLADTGRNYLSKFHGTAPATPRAAASLAGGRAE